VDPFLFFFSPRTACAVASFYFFLPRAACTVEIMFYFCRAAAARCWILIRPQRRACAAVDLTVNTVQTLRGGRMLEVCRADPVMKFVF
jgi:hypothetical protein